MANPAGGTIAAGAVGITGTGKSLTVTQTSNRAVIDWNSFSIANGETTRFVMPSSTAAVLNRVTGGQLSSLLGDLYSNGQVYLLNPNGILIGPNGRVNTAGFIASTLDVSDQQFMQGGAITLQGDSTAGVVVLGSVKANDGDVLLVAAQVDNQGALIAPNGQAILAAGSEVLYVPGEYANIAVAAPAPSSGAAVSNTGLIQAASAQLAAAGTAYQLAVNNGGQISATSVGTVGGHVVLQGGDGDVVDSGAIGAKAGAAGGTVDMNGGRIALTGTASVDVSAPSGGGRVTLAASNAISVGSQASLNADATVNGDGGRISVKAGAITQFAGAASATGGPQGGNGGQAEISGASLLHSGSVDLSAAAGKTGALLLDPDEITIVSGNAAAPSDISGGLWGFTQDSGTQTVSVGAIESLLATANLELQATTSLTVAAPVAGSYAAISSNSANTLTLTSPTTAIDAPISLPNGTLVLGWPASAVGSYGYPQSLTSSASATITAKAVQIAADYGTLTFSGAVVTPSLQFTAPTGDMAVTIANPANAIQAVSFDPSNSGNAAQSVDIETSSALTVSGNIQISGTGVLLAAGDLTLAAGTSLQGGPTLNLVSTGGVLNNLAGVNAVVTGNGQVLIYSATNGVGASGTAFNDGGIGAAAQQANNYGTASGVTYPSSPNSIDTVVEYFATTSTQPVLTITANSFTRTYGQADPTFTASYRGGSGGGSSELTTLPSFRITQGSDINAGTYTIQPYGAASSADLLNYVDGLLTVNPAPLTITANSGSMTYGGTVPFLGYQITGLVNNDSSSIVSGVQLSSRASSTASVGGYTITPSGATVATPLDGTEPNYSVSYQSGTLTVNPASLSVSAVAASTSYGSAIPALHLQFSGFVNQSDAGSVPAQFVPVVGAVQGSSAGVYAITLQTLNPNSDYSVTYTSANLTINPATLTVTPNISSTYGGAVPTTLPAADYSGFVNGDTLASLSTLPTLHSAGTSSSPVGSYSVTASGAADPNYTINYNPGTLTINRASLNITPNVTSTYGGTLPTSLPAGDYSGFVNGDTQASLTTSPVLSTAATSSSPVGNYSVTASGAADANYSIHYNPGTLTINPASLTVTPNITSTYGGTLPTSLPAGDYSGFVNGDTPASLTTSPVLNTAATSSSPVGNYNVTASGAADANYSIHYNPGTLIISPASLTIIPNLSKVYGAALPTALPTADFAGLVNGDTPASLTTQPKLLTSATASSGVGNYAITASGAADANYTIGYAPGSLDITPAPLLITADGASRQYGAGNPSFTASYSGLVNNDTSAVVSGLTLATTATTDSNAGNYAISGSGATAANYSISYAPGTLTVTQAPLLITADGASRQYGASNPSFSATYSGLINNDTSAVVSGLILATTATVTSNVGSYAIRGSGATAANYSISYAPGTLTVTQAPLLIAAIDASRSYGSSNPTLTATYSGLRNTDGPSVVSGLTFATTATQSSGVGSYPITLSGATAANYAISYDPGTLTINPAPLTITANSASRLYGAANPASGVTYSGLVNGDSSFVVSGLAVTTTATSGSNAGTYPITLAGASAANYTITYVPGVLTVSPAPLVITPNLPDIVTGQAIPGVNTALPAADFSGFVNGDTAQSLTTQPSVFVSATSSSAGTYTVTASGAVDPNYAISYQPGMLTITQAALSTSVSTTSTLITTNTNTNTGLGTLNINSTNLTVDPTTQQNLEQSQPGNLHVSQSLLNGLGLFGTGQGAAIVNEFVTTANAAGGNFTVAQVESEMNDPTVMAALMPFIMQDLTNILALPAGPCNSGQTCRTADQENFVQQVESFIQAQRQAAAIQAENDYTTWYNQQVANEVNELQTLPPGVAQVELQSIMSGNPPIPDPKMLQEAALGMYMDPSQTTTFSKIISATNGIDQMASAAQLNPSSLDGYIAGTVGDASTAISIAASTARQLAGVKGAAGGYSIIKAISPNLAKTIFPFTRATKILANARAAQIGAEATEVTEEASEATEDVTRGLEIFGDIASTAESAGQLVEAGANIIQIAVAVGEYSAISVYNTSFNKAIAADNAPVTDATLSTMLSSSGGTQTLYGYLEGFMATGGNTPLIQSTAVPASTFESQNL